MGKEEAVPATASRGPVGPEPSKKQETNYGSERDPPRATALPKSDPPKERGATAVRGDIPPEGVVEDTKVGSTRAEDTERGKGDSITQRRTLPSSKEPFLRGATRESEVKLHPETGAQVVTSDLIKDAITGEVLEVLVEPLPEEEAQEELERQVQSVRDLQQHEAESKER
jgi:hypothetical protein